MGYKKLLFRSRQFGGMKLFLTYWKIGVGRTVTSQILKLVCKRTTVDEAYAVIRQQVNKKLQRKYLPFLQNRKEYYDRQELEQKRSNKVWTCWLQGFDHAPELVRKCQESWKQYLKDKDIIQLTYENYKEYVTMPPHIVQRFEKGQMPPALFADLLRLEVLIKYGGTWMDASILCTGENKNPEIMDCDLFMFQALQKGEYRFLGTSNWFITACSNNKLLMILRDVLYLYWKDYDCTLDYYMFHDFFYTIGNMYPEDIAAMPRKNRLLPLMLMQSMGEQYDEEWIKKLMERCSFHKLNYRVCNDYGEKIFQGSN